MDTGEGTIGMSAPAWVNQYVGLPFAELGRDRAGVDCWGLVRLIYQEQFGVTLPSYTEAYRTTLDADEIGALVQGEARAWWAAVPLTAARVGDVLVLRVRNQPMHCGLVLTPPAFLHIVRGINAAVERWDAWHWNKRISGVFRHEAMTRCQ
jgi:cell wall-associated NlpC family hydrolase